MTVHNSQADGGRLGKVHLIWQGGEGRGADIKLGLEILAAPLASGSIF